MKGLEIFGKNDWRPELHSGQTDGIQEVQGQEATSSQEWQPLEVLLASSYLVEKLHARDHHSAHNEVEKGLFQAGTGSRGCGHISLLTHHETIIPKNSSTKIPWS